MPEPTAEDASVYMRLFEIASSPAQAEARSWILSELAVESYKDLDKRHPAGSAERDRLATSLGFYESVGMLVSRGLLNEDVFFDAPFGFDLVWPRLVTILDEWRKAAKDEATWENVRWLGRRYEIWKKESWKPKLEAMPPEKGPAKEPQVRGFAR